MLAVHARAAAVTRSQRHNVTARLQERDCDWCPETEGLAVISVAGAGQCMRRLCPGCREVARGLTSRYGNAA